MSVTVKQLARSGAKSRDLDAVVREQLFIIDDRLQRTERGWGRNVLAHSLPTNLALPGLEKKDAQRIVYVAIVKSLENRGFGVRLLLEPNRTTLYLEWVADLTPGEIGAMNRLIRRVRIAPGEVGRFLADETSSGRPRPGLSKGREGRGAPVLRGLGRQRFEDRAPELTPEAFLGARDHQPRRDEDHERHEDDCL